MDDGVELPVNYNGQELLFPLNLIKFGYTYQIEVDISGSLIRFERDEEGNWRAMVDPEMHTKNKMPDVGLLLAIATTLDMVANR